MTSQLLGLLSRWILDIQAVIAELQRESASFNGYSLPTSAPNLRRNCDGGQRLKWTKTLVFTNSNRKNCNKCGVRGHTSAKCLSEEECFLCCNRDHRLGKCPELAAPLFEFEDEPVSYRETSDNPDVLATCSRRAPLSDSGNLPIAASASEVYPLLDMECPPTAAVTKEATVTASMPVFSPPLSSSLLATVLPPPPADFEPCRSSWLACAPLLGSPVGNAGGTSSEPGLRLVAAACDPGLGSEPSRSGRQPLCSTYDGTSTDTESGPALAGCNLLNYQDYSDGDYSSDSTSNSFDRVVGGRGTRRRRRRRREGSLGSTSFRTMQMTRHETLKDYAKRLEEAFLQDYPGKSAGTSRRLRDQFLATYHHEFDKDVSFLVGLKYDKFDWRSVRKCISMYCT
ncbi:uncharacterized protein LOC125177890 [Hyalella azteca]|uniref:Uncharacterized protein LOC125177890 n=1 Tax=Hyalella azteca TaxID=294128 RepID=A0A979FIP6_HYAAZ|nr:uncharacterized protein LOC125177890 [Hyalella azteca]